MRKFLFIVCMACMALPVVAKPAADFYFEGYESVSVEYLREHYTEMSNARKISFEGGFKSLEWLPLYQYQRQLKDAGLNIQEFNVIKFTVQEDADSIHYVFPILLFRAAKGNLSEFKDLPVGTHLVFNGTFYTLKNDEWALVVDTIERIDGGGVEKSLLSDYRVPPTPTPTATITPTPGPNVFQRVWSKVNPKETATPSGTITPEATESPVPVVSATPSTSVTPVVKKAPAKKAGHKKHHKAKAAHKAKKSIKKAQPTVEPTMTATPNV